MENDLMINEYRDILNLENVVIAEDYPYCNIPDLPKCKTLKIRNANITTIGNLPVCETADIDCCLFGDQPSILQAETNSSGKEWLQKTNLGQLGSIGNLPNCISLTIHAHALTKIGKADKCQKLKCINESHKLVIFDSIDQISVFIRDHYHNILYTGYGNMTLRETVKQMVNDKIPFDQVDFEQSFTLYGRQDLNNMNFEGISFYGTVFKNLNLKHSNFKKCKFKNVVFDHCNLDESNFSNIDFNNTIINRCSVKDINLDYSIIPKELLFLLPQSCNTGNESHEKIKLGDSLTLHEFKIDSIFNLPRYPFSAIARIAEKEYTIEALINKEKTSTPIEFIFTRNETKFPNFLYTRNGNIINLGFSPEQLPDIIRDLAGPLKKIKNLDFGQEYEIFFDLSDADFSKYRFENVKFYNCSLTNTKFRQCSFNNVQFISCDLGHCDFSHSHVERILFNDCRMEHTNFNHIYASPNLAAELALTDNKSEFEIFLNKGAERYSEFRTIPNAFNHLCFDHQWNEWDLYIILDKNDAICYIGDEKECYFNPDYFPKLMDNTNIIENIVKYINRICTDKNQEEVLTKLSGLYTCTAKDKLPFLDELIAGHISSFSKDTLSPDAIRKLCITINYLNNSPEAAHSFPKSQLEINRFNIGKIINNCPDTKNIFRNKKHL